MPPQPGSAGQNRRRKWWRFSSWVGAPNCATRTCRGSSGATSRLIAPPLPDASHPSNRTQTGGPSCGFSPIWPPRVSRNCSSRSCAAASRTSSCLGVSFRLRSSPASPPSLAATRRTSLESFTDLPGFGLPVTAGGGSQPTERGPRRRSPPGVVTGKLHPGEPNRTAQPAARPIAARRAMRETGRVSRLSGTRWYGHATKLVVTGMVLTWTAAGCSSPSAVTGGPPTSCYQFAAQAIQRHVTVAAKPAACQGLSQVEVNVAVSRALRAAAAGVRGKVRQRQVIARDSRYVAALTRAVPASGPSTASSRPPSREAFSLAALAAWLVTAGLGVSMMARWFVRARRQGSGQQPVLNFAHFGLALTGLLVWISYLATGVTGLAWAGCGLLIPVVGLGMTLVFLAPARSPVTSLPTTRTGPATPAPATTAAAARPED